MADCPQGRSLAVFRRRAQSLRPLLAGVWRRQGREAREYSGKWPKNSNWVRSLKKWPDVAGGADVDPAEVPTTISARRPCRAHDRRDRGRTRSTRRHNIRRPRPERALGRGPWRGRRPWVGLESVAPTHRRQRADDRVHDRASSDGALAAASAVSDLAGAMAIAAAPTRADFSTSRRIMKSSRLLAWRRGMAGRWRGRETPCLPIERRAELRSRKRQRQRTDV